ncbi:MAG: DNA polymerase III subunit gamma/tau [Steroidobacteraceae bacterium]|nr:DNA polymerase III subunit gamma/tau [Steroidobacteraceae bacterium]MBP7014724.1 DNA polymerase III subunit gamma/tau [Steroidobacteraceae bacterium]
MSYLVLARKWRPRTFDQLVGQDHVRRALTNALDSGRIHHAFLFTGTRGVGKTTIARIFAKSLNCEKGVSSTPCGQCPACTDIDAGRFVDLLEVDAASRTKVDDTRELLDNVQYSPARGRYKVYLIDEVHMLSTHSFNALLKTLEEPPPHVKFLLATTDPQKLPVTVLSRCLQFHLRRLPLPLIYDRLAQIAAAEKVEFEPAALRAIARGADGSMRDALSLLDQVLAFGGGRAMEAEVRTLLGTLDRKHVQGILTALAGKDGAALMQQAAHLDERAPDYHQALGELSGAIQRMALLQALPDLPPGDDEEEDKLLAGLAAKFTAEDLQLLYQIAINSRRDLDYAPDARAGFEMALLRMLAFRPQGLPPAAPAGGGGAGIGRATVAARPAVAPSKPATVASPTAAESDWDALVASLGLQGTARHFAANCVLLERKAGLVRLRLDPAGDSFRRPQIEARLAEALSQHFGETIRLEITQAEAPGEIFTPARRDALAAEDRQRAAEESIDCDPAVRAMREVFGATVRPGSVKPLG